MSGWSVFFLPWVTVYHAYGTKRKSEKFYRDNHVFYHGCRNNITTLIKNLGRKRLFLTLPLNLSCWLILSFLFLLQGKVRTATALWQGIIANLFLLPKTLRKRKLIQKKRKISDEKLFRLVGRKNPFSYYLGKAKAYLKGEPF